MLDKREGASDELYVVKFPLGWSLLGSVGPSNFSRRISREFCAFPGRRRPASVASEEVLVD